jgi:hypothetical protein
VVFGLPLRREPQRGQTQATSSCRNLSGVPQHDEMSSSVGKKELFMRSVDLVKYSLASGAKLRSPSAPWKKSIGMLKSGSSEEKSLDSISW